MNENCESCPQLALHMPRIERIVTAYEISNAGLKEIDEQIEQCSLWDILKGARRNLVRERRTYVGDTYLPASLEYIAAIGLKGSFEACEGPFVRYPQQGHTETPWKEITCGTDARHSVSMPVEQT